MSGRRRHLLYEHGGPHREGEEPKPMMHGHEKSEDAKARYLNQLNGTFEPKPSVIVD